MGVRVWRCAWLNVYVVCMWPRWRCAWGRWSVCVSVCVCGANVRVRVWKCVWVYVSVLCMCVSVCLRVCVSVFLWLWLVCEYAWVCVSSLCECLRDCLCMVYCFVVCCACVSEYTWEFMCAIFVSFLVNVSVYEWCLPVGMFVFNWVFLVSVYDSVRVCARICMYACALCVHTYVCFCMWLCICCMYEIVQMWD